MPLGRGPLLLDQKISSCSLLWSARGLSSIDDCLGSLIISSCWEPVKLPQQATGKNYKGRLFRSPRLPAAADARLALKQYILEVECTIVVESRNDDPNEVGDDFVSRLSELAPSGEHILGLSVQVLPIPELRGSSN